MRLIPLQRPASVWSVSPGVLSVWTQSELSPSFWIIPQMLISSNEHWSSRVCVLAGKDNIMKCHPRDIGRHVKDFSYTHHSHTCG